MHPKSCKSLPSVAIAARQTTLSTWGVTSQLSCGVVGADLDLQCLCTVIQFCNAGRPAKVVKLLLLNFRWSISTAWSVVDESPVSEQRTCAFWAVECAF